MNPGTWELFRQLRSWPQPISSWISGCRQSSSPVSVLARTAAFLGLLLAVVILGWANVTMADAPDADKSTLSVRVDTTRSEFERLMAVARNTRQGTGSKLRRMAIEGRPAIGAKEAPLILVEIASFECPYCRRHWLDTMPVLRQRYIDSGELRYVFVDVVIDPAHLRAHAAAEAAHCANEQGRYAEFRNRIYENQKAIDAMFLEGHAQAVSLDIPEFRRCMTSDRYKLQVEEDTSLARKLRVRGTPSFFWAQAEPDRTDVRLVRRVSGARPIEEFARQFDALRTHNQAATATVADRPR